MSIRHVLSVVIMSFLSLFLTLTLFAQSNLDATYTAPDESYSIRYPSEWVLDDSVDGFIVLSTDDLRVTAFSTSITNDFVFSATTPAEVATSLASFVDFVLDDARSTTIGGRDATLSPVNYEGELGSAIIIEMADGSFGMLLVVGNALSIESEAALLIRVVANYNTPGADSTSSRTDNRAVALLEAIVSDESAIAMGVNDARNSNEDFSAADALRSEAEDDSDTSTAGSAADILAGAASEIEQNSTSGVIGAMIDSVEAANAVTLVNYDDGWNAVVNELALLGFIVEDGELLFEEDLAFFEGRGDYYTGLARRSARTNVVIGGEITFTSANDDGQESCGLFARVTSNLSGDALEFVQIGLSNNGEVFYTDMPEDEENSFVAFEDVDIDLSTSHFILAMLIEDEITLFLDGELIFERERINLRDGTYGVGLTGGVDGSRCEGRNIWVYSLD